MGGADSGNKKPRALELLGFDLYRIGRAIIDGDRRNVWNKILEHIVQEFEADSASVALNDKAKGELTIIAGIGHPIDLVGKTIKIGNGVMGWVANKGRPVLLNADVHGDTRFANVVHRENKPNSAICWPLNVDGHVIGTLSINRHAHSPRYTESDLTHGSPMIDVVSVVIDNARLQVEREERIRTLHFEKEAQAKLVGELKAAQQQILRCDRMASIGHLAAGVAHEINNPIGYINSNVGTLSRYVHDLLRLLTQYEGLETHCSEVEVAGIRNLKKEIQLPLLKEDTRDIFRETQEGLIRVRGIIQDLKSFCHVSDKTWEHADLHVNIDSTLNIVGYETKYRAEVVKDYGALPPVECVVSQLNQLFMNLLINAAHSIEENGTITIRTRAHDSDWVSIAVSDTGCGIAPEQLGRIFEPLYTSKPRGEGSGLGLSVCAGIVSKHGGRIEVETEVGEGTTFTVWLPVARWEAGSPDEQHLTGNEAEAAVGDE